MSLKVNNIIRAKTGLMNPVLPYTYIARETDISRLTIYRIARGKRHDSIGIHPADLPDRQYGGKPLKQFLNYYNLYNPQDARKENKYVRLSDNVAQIIKTISEAMPFLRMTEVSKIYHTSETAIHNILSGRTFTHVTASWNKIATLNKANFLNGKPFTNNSRLNSNTEDTVHGKSQRV